LSLTETAAAAEKILQEQNYDALFLDCDDLYGSKALLPWIRKTRTNKNSVLVAIVNGDTTPPDAIDLGATSTLQKPIAAQGLKDALKSSCEAFRQRRHRRISVQIPVYVSFGDTVDRLATTLNVSEGGMALRSESPIDADEPVRLKFQLPGSSHTVLLRGEIAWSDPQGFAGVRFVSIMGAGSDVLRSWLQAQTARG
jgi:DNA-binding response OmpR family regulator